MENTRGQVRANERNSGQEEDGRVKKREEERGKEKGREMGRNEN